MLFSVLMEEIIVSLSSSMMNSVFLVGSKRIKLVFSVLI